MDTEMTIVANFYETTEVAAAQEALHRAGINSTVECAQTEAGDEYSIFVHSKDFDRGAEIIEAMVVEADAHKDKTPVTCGACNSKKLTTTKASSNLWEHTVYACEDCGQIMVR